MLRLRLRDVAERPLRTAVAVAMVAVCSALVVAVAGLVVSVDTTADRLSAQVAGTADVEVTAGFSGATVPEDVVAAVEAAPGVATVAPTVQATVYAGDERALLVAGDARAASFLPPALAASFGAFGDQATPTGDTPAGGVLVGASLAESAGLGVGDTLAVRGLDGRADATVAGVLPGSVELGAVIVADLATGTRLRGGAAGYDRVLVGFAPPAVGVPAGEVDAAARRAVTAALDGRAVTVDPSARADAAAAAMEPLVQPLLLFAGVSVTVAGILVFNVVSLSVAERRRYLAIRYALGARRRRLWLGLVGEAVALGAVGGVAGAALGRTVTGLMIDQVPTALVNVILPVRIAVDVPWWLLVAGVAVGAGAAAFAAAVAGLPVVRLSPIEAMGPRDVVGEAQAPVRPAVVAVGVAVLVVGTVVAFVGSATPQMVGALAMLDGIVVLVWALRAPVSAVVAALARRAGSAGLLAALALARSPSRTAVTLLGAMLPVSAVVSLGGMQVNILDTARRGVAPLAEDDVHVGAQPFSEVDNALLLPPGLDAEVASLDGVERVTRARFTFARVAGDEVMLEGVEEGSSVPLLRVASPEARRRVHDSDAAIVTRAFALHQGVDQGDTFAIPTRDGRRAVTVADVVDMTGWPSGFAAVDYDRLAGWTGVESPGFISVRVASPEAAGAVEALVESRAGDTRLFVTPGDEAVDEAVLSVRESQTLLRALQVVLLASGAFAIVSTLVISTIGRTRELGLLRAVGARRRLVRRAVVVEAFAVTAAGAGVGVVLGTLLQAVAGRLATATSGFPADFALVAGPSVTSLVAGVAIAGVAALASLRRALGVDVLDAVAYE